MLLQVQHPEFFFLREIHIHMNVIERPVSRNNDIGNRFQPPRLGEQDIRKDILKRGGVRRFGIAAKEIVQQGGTASPESHHEDRGFFYFHGFHLPAPGKMFPQVQDLQNSRNDDRQPGFYIVSRRNPVSAKQRQDVGDMTPDQRCHCKSEFL